MSQTALKETDRNGCSDINITVSFQETGAFPLSFGFTLVGAEKVIGLCDIGTFRARRNSGDGCLHKTKGWLWGLEFVRATRWTF